MSRTDKDRPYWVVLNDETIGMTYKHDHTRFGFIGVNYWGKLKIVADHCTAFENLTWHSWDDRHYLPCRRYEDFYTGGGGKRPLNCRLRKYRRRRRDFLKVQIKRYNSNPDLHDDLEFMNEDVFEVFRDESSHTHDA
jgi:hypothetical protein